MDLHHAAKPDWSRMPPNRWNRWQRLAARTYGMVTPGNIISIIGALVVLAGLYALTIDELLIGCGLLMSGRTADILDGKAAAATMTKSPLGEAIDAAVDKVLLALAVLVLVAYNLLPLVVTFLLVLHVVYNACIVGLAYYRQITLHPSRGGKLGTAFEWVCVGSFILQQAAANQQHDMLANALLVVGYGCAGLFGWFAGRSSYYYTRQLMQGAL
jgi:phosphatidylglycerophosphate synthase